MTLSLLRPLLPRPPKTRRRERRVPEAHHLARNVDVQVRFGIHQGEDGHQFLSDPPLLPNLGELLLPPENGAKLRLRRHVWHFMQCTEIVHLLVAMGQSLKLLDSLWHPLVATGSKLGSVNDASTFYTHSALTQALCLPLHIRSLESSKRGIPG